MQAEFLRSARSGLSPTLWHTRLIGKLWLILSDIYNTRKDRISTFRDSLDPLHAAVPLARAALQHELTLGVGSLPPLLHPMMRTPPSDVADFPVRKLCQWLLSICQGREKFHDPRLLNDCFSLDGNHRAWLHLR